VRVQNVLQTSLPNCGLDSSNMARLRLSGGPSPKAGKDQAYLRYSHFATDDKDYVEGLSGRFRKNDYTLTRVSVHTWTAFEYGPEVSHWAVCRKDYWSYKGDCKTIPEMLREGHNNTLTPFLPRRVDKLEPPTPRIPGSWPILKTSYSCDEDSPDIDIQSVLSSTKAANEAREINLVQSIGNTVAMTEPKFHDWTFTDPFNVFGLDEEETLWEGEEREERAREERMAAVIKDYEKRNRTSIRHSEVEERGRLRRLNIKEGIILRSDSNSRFACI